MKCALCDDKECYVGKDCIGISEKIKNIYKSEDIKSMSISANIEAQYYMKKTRLEELIMYAQQMNYSRLGIAFCIGLSDEARTIHEILSREFKVYSVCCKVCGIDKSTFDLEQLHPEKDVDTMCNPCGQAKVMNQEKTELNIILGLCIGHDILFTKYSEAPVTTFVVKDRVLAHNPLGAIYSNYYRDKVFNLPE